MTERAHHRSNPTAAETSRYPPGADHHGNRSEDPAATRHQPATADQPQPVDATADATEHATQHHQATHLIEKSAGRKARAPRMKCLKPALVTTSQHGWKPDAIRGNRHQRGYGTAWEKQRARILERDEYLCQPGLTNGEVHVAQQVDHRIPKAAGGSDADENLQAICNACHCEKTARESRHPGGEGR